MSWGSSTGEGRDWLDFRVRLPRRSIAEFGRWVRRYGSDAVVLEPPELVAQFRQMAIALAQAYGVGAGGSS